MFKYFGLLLMMFFIMASITFLAFRSEQTAKPQKHTYCVEKACRPDWMDDCRCYPPSVMEVKDGLIVCRCPDSGE